MSLSPLSPDVSFRLLLIYCLYFSFYPRRPPVSRQAARKAAPPASPGRAAPGGGGDAPPPVKGSRVEISPAAFCGGNTTRPLTNSRRPEVGAACHRLRCGAERRGPRPAPAGWGSTGELAHPVDSCKLHWANKFRHRIGVETYKRRCSRWGFDVCHRLPG